MEFDDEPNYYITYNDYKTKIYFYNLEEIIDKDNVHSLSYRSYIYAFDLFVFKNIVLIYLVLPRITNIIFGKLVKLKHLIMNGSLIDRNEDTRMTNKYLEEFDISGCPNLISINILYFRKLRNIKHELLKKLCKLKIWNTIDDNDENVIYNDIINEYNRKNINETINLDKDIIPIKINRRKIYLLAETPLKGSNEEGPCEKSNNRICPRCSKYINKELLLNIRYLYNLTPKYFFLTYTCC